MAKGREHAAAKLREIPPNSNAQETRRKKEEWTERSGWWRQTLKDTPVPGTYNIRDFLEEASLNPLQRQASYCFRSCPRPNTCTLGIWDKDINVSPCHYDVTVKPVPKLPCKHVMFRSAVQRLSFLPKEGPSPGQYTVKSIPAKGITSCFRSTVPRLHSVRSRTPGPGAYDPSWKMGHRLSTEDMSHISGLYFRNVF
uniref:Si:ch211-93n23.7 n=1 Tax=Astyanax mexicanus TaxID=7994 RepID=A0A3B1K263_ASTMX